MKQDDPAATGVPASAAMLQLLLCGHKLPQTNENSSLPVAPPTFIMSIYIFLDFC